MPFDAAFPAPRSIRITSDKERLAAVREVTEALALAVGFSEDVARKIVLAIDEALVNVIKHGYGEAGGQPIDILLEPIQRDGRAGLRILIEDEGRQVDPDRIRGRDLDDVRPGGLGVHLMRSIMDAVEYRQRSQGMALEMTKFLD